MKTIIWDWNGTLLDDARIAVQADNILLAGEPGPYTVVGDMTHDYDMARALGADCILVAAGHQSRPVLERCGVPVLESLWELPALLHSGGDPAKGREAAQ